MQIHSDTAIIKKAVKDLDPRSVGGKKKEQPVELTVKDKKLLARVVNYYQHTFKEDSSGLDYLGNRGVSDKQSLKDFAVGFVSGSLRDILPDDDEVIKTLKKLGLLNKKGNETFYNCIVFPLYDQNGAIVNLYGRNINDDNAVR